MVLKPGARRRELPRNCRQHVKTRLAPYKYPRWIEFLAELPKTATGKIQRFKLRARLRDSHVARDGGGTQMNATTNHHEGDHMTQPPTHPDPRCRPSRRRDRRSGCCRPASLAPAGKISVGLMLPYTGTYAPLGVAIENGVRWPSTSRAASSAAARSNGSRSTTNPSRPRAPENANKLVKRDKVDVLIGTVHSGVQMGMQKVARENGMLHHHPQRRLDAATGALCAPNVFRTSFTNCAAELRDGQGDGRAA